MNNRFSPYVMEGERVDDLCRDGLHILQKKDGFRFGMDTVLLSSFCRIRKGAGVCDLGTGTGILPILLCAKTGAAKITGIEIQKDMADMARRSVAMNGLEDRVRIVVGDLRESHHIFGRGFFDVVTANPPYMKSGSGKRNASPALAAARHELNCTLEDVISSAAAILKEGGRFFMVGRTERLADAFFLLREYGLEPKRLRLVHPMVGREASLYLVEAVRGAHVALRVGPALVIYKSPGVYTDAVREIYGD